MGGEATWDIGVANDGNTLGKRQRIAPQRNFVTDLLVSYAAQQHQKQVKLNQTEQQILFDKRHNSSQTISQIKLNKN